MPQQRAELVMPGQYKCIEGKKKTQRLLILIIPKREKNKEKNIQGRRS